MLKREAEDRRNLYVGRFNTWPFARVTDPARCPLCAPVLPIFILALALGRLGLNDSSRPWVIDIIHRRYARIVAVSWPAGPFVRAIRNSRLRCGLRTSTCPRWTLGPDYPSVSRATVGTRGPATCVHVRTTAFRPRPPDPCGLGPGDTTWTSRDAGPDLQSEHRSAAGHRLYIPLPGAIPDPAPFRHRYTRLCDSGTPSLHPTHRHPNAHRAGPGHAPRPPCATHHSAALWYARRIPAPPSAS